MALHPCIECGKLTKNPRCTRHRTPRTNQETVRRKQAVDEHKARHGNWCPGWGIEPHYSEDLTADHLIPQVKGGQKGPLRVLCRSCNARRGIRGWG